MPEVKFGELKKHERPVTLNSLELGQAFRLAEDTVCGAKEHKNMWFKAPEYKAEEGRVEVVSTNLKERRKFDADRMVIKHGSTVTIHPN